MYISATIHSASTGLVEQRLDYACHQCGAQAMAAVRTIGADAVASLYGETGGAEQARLGAVQAASKNAVEALTTVPCPDCGALPPELSALLAQVDAAHAGVEQRRRLRLPIAASAAGLTAVATLIPAILDFHNTKAGLFAALGATAFVASVVVYLLSLPSTLPALVRRAEVWLARGHVPSEIEWVPAPGLPQVRPISPARLARRLSMLAAVLGLAEASVAGASLLHSFMKVWVIDTAGRGDVTVEIDGKPAGPIRLGGESTDVSFATFRVRRGHEHQVVLVDPSGARRTFTLDVARDHKRGWVVAPDAAEHDLCVVDSQTIYRPSGSAGTAPDAKLLDTAQSDVVPVMTSIDHAFVAPPSTITVEKDRGDVRTRALRAFSCSALVAGRLVPFRERAANHRPSDP